MIETLESAEVWLELRNNMDDVCTAIEWSLSHSDLTVLFSATLTAQVWTCEWELYTPNWSVTSTAWPWDNVVNRPTADDPLTYVISVADLRARTQRTADQFLAFAESLDFVGQFDASLGALRRYTEDMTA